MVILPSKIDELNAFLEVVFTRLQPEEINVECLSQAPATDSATFF